jgi:hypothetical protein
VVTRLLPNTPDDLGAATAGTAYDAKPWPLAKPPVRLAVTSCCAALLTMVAHCSQQGVQLAAPRRLACPAGDAKPLI